MNKSSHARVDRTKVVLEDQYQVGYWTAKWHVDETSLRNAVETVGNEPAALMQYLRIPGHHISKTRVGGIYGGPGVDWEQTRIRNEMRHSQLAQRAVGLARTPKHAGEISSATFAKFLVGQQADAFSVTRGRHNPQSSWTPPHAPSERRQVTGHAAMRMMWFISDVMTFEGLFFGVHDYCRRRTTQAIERSTLFRWREINQSIFDARKKVESNFLSLMRSRGVDRQAAETLAVLKERAYERGHAQDSLYQDLLSVSDAGAACARRLGDMLSDSMSFRSLSKGPHRDRRLPTPRLPA